MNAEQFGLNINGQLVLTAKGNTAFVPFSLPPDIDWSDSSLIDSVITAAEAVARLSGAAHDVAAPFLVDGISNVFANKEARLSSKIEGIHTTTVQVLIAQEEDQSSTHPESREVLNYLRALRIGLKRIRDPQDLPICNRLIQDLHKHLLQGVRGKDKSPGEFRKIQNFLVEKEGDDEAQAVYVPPPPNEMLICMDQLQRTLHDPAFTRLNVYARIAFVHYQFEAIHPFMDGNGRVGRLLILLMLCDAGKLSHPLIYPSAFYDANKLEYYRRLFDVSLNGEWVPWIQFILKGIETQAQDGLARLNKLRELHMAYRARFQDRGHSGKLLKLIDLLFYSPVVSSGILKRHLGLGGTTAKRYLELLQAEEIIAALFTERRRNQYYQASAIMDAIGQD